jgi:tRNA-uridine 2-sulfurtransferase
LIALKNKTVVIAMSGGVDSSVAAVLLHEQGYRVIGVTMKLWDFEKVGGNINHESGCCSVESFNDARSICVERGFPHYIVNFSREFHTAVVEDFIDEYLAGRTPNPCVQCNTKIKWHTLVEKASELGADYIATGHYAISRYNDQSGRNELIRAVDKSKDQSYALWGIRQTSLSKTLFPLGNLTKIEVRKLAENYGLPTAQKPESQEICFIPDNNYHRLLKDHTKDISSGDMVDISGNVIGQHEGYPFYTIGQRKGLGGGFKKPMYVVNIDSKNNQITVGDRTDLMSQEFIVKDINLISVDMINEPIQAQIKIRYNDIGHDGILIPESSDTLRIKFHQPQKSVTPGQSAVFFDDEIVIGGGIIEKRIN